MSLINVKVVKIASEGEGIRSFLLRNTGFFKLPAYEPGAHIDVHCGEGIIRQYSLCGDQNDRHHYMIAVKQVELSRGGSDLMHLSVQEGDRLEIGSPRNNFSLYESAPHAVLLAGGIGITPIIAMADRLNALGRSFELHYFSRGPEHTAFQNRLLRGSFATRVSLHEGLDVAATKARLKAVFASPQPRTQVYICGPGLFMASAESTALKTIPAADIKLERFAANPATNIGPTAPFQIELAQSETTLEVGAKETILDVLQAHGIDAAFSCEQGVCGTCVTRVLEGEPDHRDSFLSPKQRRANQQICLCVSRSKSSKLVLEL